MRPPASKETTRDKSRFTETQIVGIVKEHEAGVTTKDLSVPQLNIVSDFTRECLAIEVDTSLSGVRITRVFDAVGAIRGCPETLVMDNSVDATLRNLQAKITNEP